MRTAAGSNRPYRDPALITFGVDTDAFLIDEFGIEVDSRIPRNRVKGNFDLPEQNLILESLKDTEIQKRFHVQSAALSIVKNDRKQVIVIGDDLCNGWDHASDSYWSGCMWKVIY